MFKLKSGAVVKVVPFLLLILAVIFTVVFFVFNNNNNVLDAEVEQAVNSSAVSNDVDVLTANFNKCTSASVQVSNESMKCALDSLVGLASLGEVEQALSLLDKAKSTNSAITASCHGWAHSIGLSAASFKEYDIDYLYSLGWDKCTYGFFHGVQSHYLTSMKSLDEASKFYDLACTPPQDFVAKNEFIINCGHLFGHFIADLSMSDPMVGLEQCYSFIKLNESSPCVDGLLMRYSEFIDVGNGGDDVFVEIPIDMSKFDSVSFFGGKLPTATRNVFALCKDKDETIQASCAKRTAFIIYRLVERDFPNYTPTKKWSVVHDYCAMFKTSLQPDCFNGIGGIALNMSGWEPSTLITACEAGPGSQYCIETIAKAFASYNPTISADEAFCSKVSESLLDACRKGFDSGLESF